MRQTKTFETRPWGRGLLTALLVAFCFLLVTQSTSAKQPPGLYPQVSMGQPEAGVYRDHPWVDRPAEEGNDIGFIGQLLMRLFIIDYRLATMSQLTDNNPTGIETNRQQTGEAHESTGRNTAATSRF